MMKISCCDVQSTHVRVSGLLHFQGAAVWVDMGHRNAGRDKDGVIQCAEEI